MMESFSAGQSIEAQKREEFLKTNQLFTELIENQTETERAAAEASQQLIDSQAAARAEAFKGAIDMGIQVLGAFQALNEAFSGDSEKQQKKAFQRNKAIGISTAIINTAGAIVGAINPASSRTFRRWRRRSSTDPISPTARPFLLRRWSRANGIQNVCHRFGGFKLSTSESKN